MATSFQVRSVKRFWGIKIDIKLTFEEHVEGLCKRASQKASNLARIRNYNFRYDFLIKRCNIQSVYYGTETAAFVGPKIWDTLPNSCKDATSLKSFKVNLKS